MRKVIKYQSMPPRLPINSTGLGYLLMEHFNATDAAWGAFWAVVIFIWLGSLLLMLTVEFSTPLFEGENNGK